MILQNLIIIILVWDVPTFLTETLASKYEEFHKYATQKFDKVSYMIIGRDRNILEHQQNRVRGKHTTPKFLEQLDFFLDKEHIFVSQELIYLYGIKYINSIEEKLGLPKNTNSSKIDEILSEDKNKKYMSYVEYTELDDLIKLASSKRGGVMKILIFGLIVLAEPLA